MTRILLTGKTGQVGYELERSPQGLGEIIALNRSQMEHANLAQMRDVIRTIKPHLIVNPAAYTAVDKAESEANLAMCINGAAPGVMVEEARNLGATMIHYSTDYVFDGSKTTPYLKIDPTCPINVYGATKLAGEQAIQAACIRHLSLRTSWVYGMCGNNSCAPCWHKSAKNCVSSPINTVRRLGATPSRMPLPISWRKAGAHNMRRNGGNNAQAFIVSPSKVKPHSTDLQRQYGKMQLLPGSRC